MAKEVVFKVGDFVTPVETGNTIGIIHKLDDVSNPVARKNGPIKVLYLDLDGYPNGIWGYYKNDQLIKTPRKYRLQLKKTGKAIIKDFDNV